MTHRSSARCLVLVASVAALSGFGPANLAMAKGGTGGGGGGTTTTAGVIARASAVATCDGPTTAMTVTVDKGRDKRVEMAVAYSAKPAGFWGTTRLVNDATGLSINSYGGFPTSAGSGVW